MTTNIYSFFYYLGQAYGEFRNASLFYLVFHILKDFKAQNNTSLVFQYYTQFLYFECYFESINKIQQLNWSWKKNSGLYPIRSRVVLPDTSHLLLTCVKNQPNIHFDLLQNHCHTNTHVIFCHKLLRNYNMTLLTLQTYIFLLKQR